MERVATPADLPAATRLWQQVFGDEEAFVRATLNDFVGPGNLCVSEEEGRIAAILSAAPCMLEGWQGVYLYALATLPECRGRGAMSRLMAMAESQAAQRGAAFASLIPASPPLYDWYRRRGYGRASVLRRFAYTAKAAAKASAEFDFPGPRRFEELRSRYLPKDWLAFDSARTQIVLNDMEASGLRAAAAEGAYAIYKPRESDLLVAELGAKDDAHAKALLDAVALKENRLIATITLAQGSSLWQGMGEPEPSGLVKPLHPAFVADPIYIRFALDKL